MQYSQIKDTVILQQIYRDFCIEIVRLDGINFNVLTMDL